MEQNIPLDSNQRFQIGDVCRIVHTDSRWRYPPITDEEDPRVGVTVLIVGSYWQTCGLCRNLTDYVVVAPIELNPERYDSDGCYRDEELTYGGEFAWSWIREFQLQFLRKPTDEELKKAYGYYVRWSNGVQPTKV